jgi:hypothetical protein
MLCHVVPIPTNTSVSSSTILENQWSRPGVKDFAGALHAARCDHRNGQASLSPCLICTELEGAPVLRYDGFSVRGARSWWRNPTDGYATSLLTITDRPRSHGNLPFKVMSSLMPTGRVVSRHGQWRGSGLVQNERSVPSVQVCVDRKKPISSVPGRSRRGCIAAARTGLIRTRLFASGSANDAKRRSHRRSPCPDGTGLSDTSQRLG